MADTYLLLKAIDALVYLHTAIKNMQIYPSLNPTIINSIETLYLHLLDKLRQDAPQDFAKLEKTTPLYVELLKQQENETIHISALLDIILGSGLKNISFDKDLVKEELHISINLPDNKVDEPMEKEELHISINLPDKNKIIALSEESLRNLAAKDKIDNILPDNKADEIMEKDQEIVFNRDISESRISENIAEMKKVLSRLREREGTTESLFSEDERVLIKRLSGQVIEWIETETSVTPAYKEICQCLQTLIEGFIKHKLFAEANPIIDIFNKINSGALKKDNEVLEITMEVLRNLASEKNINILFNEININEKNKINEACQILFGFGDIVMNKLLNSVRDACDSKERIRIIHIIQEMGDMAIPAIKNSITISAPWYYLRNMAYILGRIGNENSSDILRPLLLHKDKRVHIEALKSITQIGGSKRGPLLLSVLYQVDQEFRLNIIETLGKIKCTEAVTDLLYTLQSKSTMAKDAQISLQEKICNALGAIGSREAIPALSEIAESKSFLGIQSYPKEVIFAAKRALTTIKKIQVLD